MKNRKMMIFLGFMVFIVIVISCFSGCITNNRRLDSIPDDAVKMTPETDVFPPVLHSEEWEYPIPMPGPANTAGAEDAPVISPDGNLFLFFFTPDVTVPPEKQLLDGVSGIWWMEKVNGVWTEPARAILKYGLALDGPLCIVGDTLWFCSARSGNYRELDIYTAELNNNKWGNWKNAGELLNVEYEVGELYLTGDGNTMVFDSPREGGFGGKDLWITEKVNGQWTEPVNLGEVINTEFDEGLPYISPDGNELWYTSWSTLGYQGPALFRSIKDEFGTWGSPEEIISNFAGDPGLDAQGNIYFTHHFFTEDMVMIEADIYVAYKK
ncbi:MAG: hypothetical protein R6V50_07805 [Thermoplasmatota archaeon]